MLVLDNCEHVVGAAAQTAEALLRRNPATRVIGASRENWNQWGGAKLMGERNTD
jgi:predicted ATPase